MMKPRHSLELINEVISTRQRGESLNGLVSRFNLPKSTVQGWIARTQISVEAKSIILNRARQQRIIALKRRRIALPGNIYRRPLSPNLVRFFAHCLFDGSIFSDQVVYYSSHVALAEEFAADGKQLFGLKPRWRITPEKIYRVYFFSKNLVDFLNDRKASLLEQVTELSYKHRIEFLKAFFNDEGSVTFRLKECKRAIRGYQKERKILDLISQLLKQLGIISKLENLNRFPEVVIRGQENIRLFAEQINFAEGVSFLARRKNSYYKRPTEKRSVLKSLLNSYI